jgi:outer membrane protein TolC
LQANLTAIETKQKAGFANMIDVEDARRSLMQTQKSALTLQQDRANAWLNLYRAAGGGWQLDTPIESAAITNNTKEVVQETQGKETNEK